MDELEAGQIVHTVSNLDAELHQRPHARPLHTQSTPAAATVPRVPLHHEILSVA